MTSYERIRDLTDEEARRSLVLKWGASDPDVLPAWVAEMDYALAPPVAEALERAVADGVTGYPAHASGGPLGNALAAFAERRLDWAIDPEQVIATVDTTAGVRIALETLSDPGPLVLPTPAYHPQFGIAQLSGRETWELPVEPSADSAMFDLEQLESLLAKGARTLLLTQPHNPLGHVYTRTQLAGIRDIVRRYDARVISDEVHAPLVLPGARHVPYLSLEGTAEHAVAVTATSKAFNTPGLRCAQIVTADPATRDRLLAEPMCRNNSWSPLGEVAAVAAYTRGDGWLDALLERLDQLRRLLGSLLADELPLARMRPLAATYLGWLDLRAYAHDDPAALALDKGRLHVEAGHRYQPGLTGHVRVNLATSPERLTEIVRRLALAIT